MPAPPHACVRRKLLACLGAGLVVFAAMTPSQLGSADQVPFLQQFTTAPAAASSFGCDRPRGHAAYRAPDCDAPRRAPGRALGQARAALGGVRAAPNTPIVFHFESGRAGTISHTITPMNDRISPVARPGFSP